MPDDVTVIIRSSGERTLSYCKKLLSLQIPEQQIIILEEKPFSAALRKGFEMGIEKGTQWLLCIDADVLVRENVVKSMLDIAGNLSEKIFLIQGTVLDKFFPIKRPAGNHLYRSEFIEQAVKLIPEEGKSLRPESDMRNAMTASGHQWQQIDFVVGLHDFRQYYCDIYKKCFLQAHKHTRHISLVESYWESQKLKDTDFLVALSGLNDGKSYNDKVYVDRDFLDSETKNELKLMEIEEKKPIPEVEFKVSSIDSILSEQEVIVSRNRELQKKMFPPKSWNKVHGIAEEDSEKRRISHRVRKMLHRLKG